MYLLTLLATLSFSCNNLGNSKEDHAQNSKKIDIAKKLTIRFNFKTNKSDVFKIMMNNIEVDELQKKNIHIFEEVVPSTGDDTIVVEFDANNMSKQIVFHLGNKNEKELEIKSILVSYGNNQYNLSTVADINKYLIFNKFVERDSLSKNLKTIRLDGRLNPSFRIKNNLINLLKRK
ncbi:hypothetical protein [Winogradskyella sp.]|uniref:hypothetical protein n=1 Tax=Winogradskyella sp. TaxID=1883156 RepID=UPI003F6BC3D8